MRTLLIAAVLGLGALPLHAGGRMVCPAGYVAAQDARGHAVCALPEAVGSAPMLGVVRRLERPASERRGRLVCRYPHRPSDSVFLNGSGYLIKDDVRRRMGCL